jgi:ATP-dependent DNA helicase 2 subunit 1
MLTLQDIIYRDPAEGDSQFAASITNFKSSSEDGISLLNRLISDINSKQVAKRTLFSNLPFEIGPDFKISVKGYNLLQTQEPSRRCYVYTEGEKAKLVKGETKYSADDNAKGRVEKADITKAYKFGGTEISFTPQEMKEIRNFGAPVLRVIGFKPQSMLPIWASIKKSTFIFPSEEHFIGSTRVFVAFWKKLLKDKLMGLAWYIARANATPILVAILPGEEKLDEITNAQVMPAGLWLYPLPFADDLRPLPAIPKPPENPIELTVAMRKVIKYIVTLPFDGYLAIEIQRLTK